MNIKFILLVDLAKGSKAKKMMEISDEAKNPKRKRSFSYQPRSKITLESLAIIKRGNVRGLVNLAHKGEIPMTLYAMMEKLVDNEIFAMPFDSDTITLVK